MSRIVHLNGEYLPEDQAKVSVFDRGFVMADAVYEVTSVLDGKLIDFPGHMARLARSLGELGIHGHAREEISTGTWTPPVDIYETDGELILLMDLPEHLYAQDLNDTLAQRDLLLPKLMSGELTV